MSLFNELKRRNVIRVAVAYLALAWLLIEVAGTLFPAFGIPDWGVRFIVILFGLGFVPALVISWVYELTPEGLKREEQVVRDTSITHLTARRLDVFTIGMIMVALVFILGDRLWLNPRGEQPITVPAEVDTETVKDSEPSSLYPPNSIAVLPFVNMSSDVEQEYFSDGISEELLNLLAKVPELRVISRSSAFSFKGEKDDIPTIAEQLNVAYILEGSVRKAGDQVRITAQLIETQSDSHLWSETYDRELKNIFALQDEIATAISGALIGHMGVEIEVSPVVSAVVNTEAHDALLRGRYLLAQRTSASLEGAVRAFGKAVELAPDSALTHAELVIALGIQRYYVNSPKSEMLLRATPHAERALALDPNLAEANAAMGALRANQGRIEEALEHYSAAIKINPNYSIVYIWMAADLDDIGSYQQAFEMRKTARQLDPVSIPAIRAYFLDLVYRSRLPEASRELEILASLDPVGYPRLSGILENTGWDWANETFGYLESLVLDPSSVRTLRSLSTRFAFMGLEQEALTTSEPIRFSTVQILGNTVIAEDVVQTLLARSADNPVSHRDLARAWATTGNFEQARPLLEEMWQLTDGRVTRRGVFRESEALALIMTRRVLDEDAEIDHILAAISDNVRRYRESGISTRPLFSADYEEGLVAYLSGEREKGLELIDEAAEDGYFIPAGEAYMQMLYDDPGFALILARQKARQTRERGKFLAVVCTNNPYTSVWESVEGTCKLFTDENRN